LRLEERDVSGTICLAHTGVRGCALEGRGGEVGREGESAKRWKADNPSKGGEREYLDGSLRGRGRDVEHVHGWEVNEMG
jgi:hypothetical protein